LITSGKIIGTTTIFNEAICGSGTGRRNWSTSEKENLHHIVNANTGKPTEEISAVWIKAKTTTIADGLATAIFFVEPDTLKSFFEKQFDFEYLIIYKNKKILFSKNFDIKF
jgi:thiamine biosynthesis lipoprotein